MSASETLATPPAGLLRRLWRGWRITVVVGIVSWHLFFFAFRNPLDLWEKPIYSWLRQQPGWGRWGKCVERADDLTYRFGNLVGCEQRWVMFRPPMARGAWFLAFRLEFQDGSSELLRSTNEPDQPARFFRLGDWQIRKFEDYLCFPEERLESSPERGLWEAYVREKVRSWQRLHPEDSRELRRVVMLRRRIQFTGPEDTPGDYPPPRSEDFAAFDREGRLLP